MRQILNAQDNQLRHLIDKSHELTTLDARVKKLLSTELAPHCTVANFQQGCLVIAVNDAAWATHLRYQIPALLQNLRTKGQLYNLRTIRSYVKPPVQAIKKPMKKPPRLSQRGSNSIVETATHIKNEDLRNALLRLAKEK